MLISVTTFTAGLSVKQTCFLSVRLLLHALHGTSSITPCSRSYSSEDGGVSLIVNNKARHCAICCVCPAPTVFFFKCYFSRSSPESTPPPPPPPPLFFFLNFSFSFPPPGPPPPPIPPNFYSVEQFHASFHNKKRCFLFLLFTSLLYSLSNRISCNKGHSPA